MKPLFLLTGATGFVGRQVLRELGARGLQVRLVVRAGKEKEVAEHDAVSGIIGTPDLFLEDAAWWAEVCQGVDTVIHAAWYAEPGKYLQSAKNRECLNGTLQLAKGAAETGVRRFVGIGTCFEYDLTKGVLTTNSPLRPLSPYAEAKAATYTSLAAYLPEHGVEFVWCRLFYLYGDGEDERRLIAYIRHRLAQGEPAELTSGTQVRDFLDVREAGKMVVAAAVASTSGVVNICSGTPVTVRQMAERIADEYGRRDLLRFGARPDDPCDPRCVVGVGDQ